MLALSTINSAISSKFGGGTMRFSEALEDEFKTKFPIFYKLK
jgi:hypothetical protein